MEDKRIEPQLLFDEDLRTTIIIRVTVKNTYGAGNRTGIPYSYEPVRRTHVYRSAVCDGVRLPLCGAGGAGSSDCKTIVPPGMLLFVGFVTTGYNILVTITQDSGLIKYESVKSGHNPYNIWRASHL